MADKQRKIEWLETVKIAGGTKVADTTDFVTEEDYQLYVHQLGWAKDAETGEHAERKPGAVKIQPKQIVQPNS